MESVLNIVDFPAQKRIDVVIAVWGEFDSQFVFMESVSFIAHDTGKRQQQIILQSILPHNRHPRIFLDNQNAKLRSGFPQ